MKFSSLIVYLVAVANRNAHGFGLTSIRSSAVISFSQTNGSRSLVLGMTEDGYNEEVAKLMAAAAKARAEATKLAKVRL
jgi:hypothetical protein